MKILVNSCTMDLDSKGVSKSRKLSAVGLQEKGKQADSKFRKVSMNIPVEDRGNKVAKFKS